MNLIRQMKVTLKGAEHSKTLVYDIFSDRTSQLWAQSLLKSARHSSLKEKNRFYNFADSKAELKTVLKSFEEVTARLKGYHPELDFPELDANDLQNSVNRLHVDFAHAHHVTKLVSEKTNADWDRFNTLLHSAESILHNEKFLTRYGLPLARVAFTWNDTNLADIPDEGFSRFKLPLEFGTAYANYTQVGRQFLEIVIAKDDGLNDGHIQPMKFVSADTLLWFGPSFGPEWTASRMKQLHEWFQQREERYRRLGFIWGDAKLALGNLPVAQLQQAPVTQSEILQFIKELGRCNEVDSVIVT